MVDMLYKEINELRNGIDNEKQKNNKIKKGTPAPQSGLKHFKKEEKKKPSGTMEVEPAR